MPGPTGTDKALTRPMWTPRALAQLGKLRLLEIWTGPVLAGSLLFGEGALDPRSAALCLIFVLVVGCTICASHAFDDITGYLDGSDIRNYAPERRRSQVKPLVQGTLTVRAARVFAYVCVAAGAAAVTVFWVVAGPGPWWTLVGGLAFVVLGAQYSAGINFSYRFLGGGELLTGVTLAASVWLPYGAATGSVGAAALLQGALFGSWFVLVLICSNSADADDDREVGRRTVAARVSGRANLVFLVAAFGTSWGLAVVGVVAGVLQPWILLGLLPAWALQAVVLRNGLRGRWRNRRNYGFIAVRLALLGMVIVNVVS